MNILIAEDNITLQMVIEKWMDNWGYKCDIAPNGLEAVRKARQNEGKYDLCLMDIDMPFMDGFEATEQIRKYNKDIPIMALTSHNDIKKRYTECGMDAFLEKPYDSRVLYNKIKELTLLVAN